MTTSFILGIALASLLVVFSVISAHKRRGRDRSHEANPGGYLWAGSDCASSCDGGSSGGDCGGGSC